jgi:hypothetical protein
MSRNRVGFACSSLFFSGVFPYINSYSDNDDTSFYRILHFETTKPLNMPAIIPTITTARIGTIMENSGRFGQYFR